MTELKILEMVFFPDRFAILKLLKYSDDGLNITDIADALNSTHHQMKFHIDIMEKAGLVTSSPGRNKRNKLVRIVKMPSWSKFLMTKCMELQEESIVIST